MQSHNLLKAVVASDVKNDKITELENQISGLAAHLATTTNNEGLKAALRHSEQEKANLVLQLDALEGVMKE